MSAKRYRATRTVEIVLDGKSLELEAAIEFTISPYVPEKGPSYASGGQPAEGGHVEDVWCRGVKDAGTPAVRPEWLNTFIVESVDRDALYQEAMGDEAAASEAAQEMKADERRDEAAFWRDIGLGDD